MRTVRTHYEALGLPKSATLAQIKRRYKELVRKYHPDVAEDKRMAHRLFIQITDAYQVLTDPVRRKAYDETLELRAQRSAPPDPPKAQPRAQPRQQVRSSGERLQSEHLKEAQWAYIQRRFHEAAGHCKEALRENPMDARAHAMLGDVYRALGRTSAAVQAYTFALQYDPKDRETERKLTNLVGKRIGLDRDTVSQPTPGARVVVANAIGWGLVFFLVMLINVHPGEPVEWLHRYIPQVSTWSWNLVALMAAASFTVAALLSLNGFLKHPDDELVFETSEWALIPAGLILLIGSGFFFLGAAAFYIVVGLIQGSLSRSVLITFACVVGIVVLSAIMYLPNARMQVLLFGGNVAFLASLFGWYTGSMLKPLNY